MEKQSHIPANNFLEGPFGVSSIAHHISKANDYGIADESIDLHSTSIQSLLLDRKSVNKGQPSNSTSFQAYTPVATLSKHEIPITSSRKSRSEKLAFHARVQTMVDHPLSDEDDSNIIFHNDSKIKLHLSSNTFKTQGSPVCQDPDNTASTGDGYLQFVRGKKEDEPLSEAKCSPGITLDVNPVLPKPVPKIMDSNVLSAILCLVKELDFASLDVVKSAIHHRFEEIND